MYFRCIRSGCVYACYTSFMDWFECFGVSGRFFFCSFRLRVVFIFAGRVRGGILRDGVAYVVLFFEMVGVVSFRRDGAVYEFWERGEGIVVGFLVSFG